MTRTCLGLPTLEKTAERNVFYFKTDVQEYSPDIAMDPQSTVLVSEQVGRAQLAPISFLIHFSVFYIKSI